MYYDKFVEAYLLLETAYVCGILLGPILFCCIEEEVLITIKKKTHSTIYHHCIVLNFVFCIALNSNFSLIGLLRTCFKPTRPYNSATLAIYLLIIPYNYQVYLHIYPTLLANLKVLDQAFSCLKTDMEVCENHIR